MAVQFAYGVILCSSWLRCEFGKVNRTNSNEISILIVV